MTINVAAIPNQSLLGRLARLPLKLIPRSAVFPVMQGPLRGKKWIVGSGLHGCWLGTYEYDKQLRFTSTLKPGMTVYDIGANVGFYSLLSAVLVGPQGRVFAFEPLPRNLGYLRRHVALNKMQNITVVDKALSDREGTVTFEEGPAHTMGKMGSSGTLQVAMTTVDIVRRAAHSPDPSLLKIDVEGAEMLVLKGAEQTLRQCRPVIFLATHGAQVHKDCCEYLKALGYRLSPLSGASVETADEILAEPERA